MASRILFSSLLVTFGALVAVSGAPSQPPRAAILPPAEAAAVIKQCSRNSPREATSFWTPSAAEVAAIEERLPKLLRASGRAIKLSGSYRQYVGVVWRGKKLIYVNAFPEVVLSLGRDTPDWRKKAVTVCDGGDVFWGVEYDPASGTFHRLKFNGAA